MTNPGCSVGSGIGTVQSPGVINGSGITISRDGSTLYVGGKGGNPALTTFSTSPFAVTNNYNVGGLAMFGLTVSPDGRYLFAIDNYGAVNTARFHVVDLQAQGGPAEVTGSPFFTNANAVRAYP